MIVASKHAKKTLQIFKKEPYNLFAAFADPEKDRFNSLDSILKELKLHHSIVNIGERKHFFVSSHSKEKPETVLVAHYDSVPGCTGANDNASGVFLLLSVALRLRKMENQPWLIIFTDKEELVEGEGIRAQGSFLLATGLKNTDIGGADFYIFDCIGRDGTVIISTVADYIIKKETGVGVAHLQKRLHDLRNQAISAAERAYNMQQMLMPTPFSDDAGFIRAGIAAQTITALPSVEAAKFAQLARLNPNYINALVNKDFRDNLDLNILPETWNIINSNRDTIETLLFENASGMAKFAIELITGKKN